MFESLDVEHARRHATEFVAGWFCLLENTEQRQKVRAYQGTMGPDVGTAYRRVILETVAPIPLPAGDRMEIVTGAIQSMFSVVDWVAVDRQVSEAVG